MTIDERAGLPVLMLPAEGPQLHSEADCLDVIAEAFSAQVGIVVIPVQRLSQDFFVLRTGAAGAIVQKFVNYGLVLAVLGDISAHVAASDALRAYVGEANRGRHTWFVANLDELDQQLARVGLSRS